MTAIKSIIGGKENENSKTLQMRQERKRRKACSVSYTHLRAHETVLDLVCRLLLEKKKKNKFKATDKYTNYKTNTDHYQDTVEI